MSRFIVDREADYVPVWGYYDPKEDERTGCEDKYTGWYYLTLD